MSSTPKFGELHFGVKSDLLKCLEKLYISPATNPVVDATLIDGAALVNLQKPTAACKTFSDYHANIIYLPYIKKQLRSAQRVDVIWDRYIEQSLKVQTRKRGTGIRRSVEPDVKIPEN